MTDPSNQSLSGETSLADQAVRGTAPRFETVLDLDELMTAGRRPERTARFCIRADLVADVEALDAELEELDAGEPRRRDAEVSEEPLTSRRGDLLAERAAKRTEMARFMRTVRVRAMPDAEWKAHEHKHRGNLAEGDPYPLGFWDEMIAACAIAPVLSLEQVRRLRAELSQSQFDAIRLAAFRVNTATGVDIPKSLDSSDDPKPRRRS